MAVPASSDLLKQFVSGHKDGIAKEHPGRDGKRELPFHICGYQSELRNLAPEEWQGVSSFQPELF
jgi:hypothetical protein